MTDSTEGLSPPSMHHKRSVGSLSPPSSSSPSLQSLRLQCPLRQRRPSPPLCRHCLHSRAAAGDGRLPRRPRPCPRLLLLCPSHSCPDLLLIGGITVPPLKIWVQSSRPPSFSSLERFIVVWGRRGRTSSTSSSPLRSLSLSSLPHPPHQGLQHPANPSKTIADM